MIKVVGAVIAGFKRRIIPSRGAPNGRATLFYGKEYALYFVRRNRRREAVVTFEPLNSHPTLDGDCFAERYLERRRINSYHIKAAGNDWYQGAEINAVVAALRKASRFQRLIGYGGSMGAFGVINFASSIRLRSFFAFAPQYSLDSTVVPFENRWKVPFRYSRIATGRPLRRGYIFYDPATLDGRHAELILARHALTPVRLYFAEHHPLVLLQECNLLEGVLEGLSEGRFDAAALNANLRSRRRQSYWFWWSFSHALLSSGRSHAALRAWRHAQTIGDPSKCAALSPWLRDEFMAELLASVGRGDEAKAMLGPYIGTAEYAGFLTQKGSNWPEQTAAAVSKTLARSHS